MFNRSKVDILRFAMSYSCCLISDPGSARLAKETTDSPTGPGRAFFKAEPATNQCIAAAEVMLKDGHKGTNRLSTIACRPGLPLSDAPPADPKFPAQCIAPQRNRTLKAHATGQAISELKLSILLAAWNILAGIAHWLTCGTGLQPVITACCEPAEPWAPTRNPRSCPCVLH